MAEDPKIFNENDTMDINELISLNNDISDDLIEQLQNKVTQSANQLTGKSTMPNKDDSELFEEVEPKEENSNNTETTEESAETTQEKIPEEDEFAKKYRENHPLPEPVEENVTQPTEDVASDKQEQIIKEMNEIEKLTSGNIKERPLEPEQVKYKESLNFIDDNKKYSKYVIYIDPENEEFIESLTVKERKNIINQLIKEQNSITISKNKINAVQKAIKHGIIALITISLAVPFIYMTMNAALEVTIENYRYSKSIFKTLYKKNGKVKIQNIDF